VQQERVTEEIQEIQKLQQATLNDIDAIRQKKFLEIAACQVNQLKWLEAMAQSQDQNMAQGLEGLREGAVMTLGNAMVGAYKGIQPRIEGGQSSNHLPLSHASSSEQ
jgi:hypothetical protein